MKSLFNCWGMIGGLVVCFFSLISCIESMPQLSLVPQPHKIEQRSGAFIVKNKMQIGISDEVLKPAAMYLSSMLSGATNYTFSVVRGNGDISLINEKVGDKPGAYTLQITSNQVQIKGNGYAGVIYAIQTLRQLLPIEIEYHALATNVTWKLPAVVIEDQPRYEWRGLMLDVSRHFYDKAEIQELLDLMSLYKMNKFHWHLTDDQGWRVEIKHYPLLTEKGAWRTLNKHDRACMNLALKEDNSDYNLPQKRLRIDAKGDTLYGGFYTQEDIKEIVAYAAVRGIDVIPEVDMPGHMLAAVSNYKGLSCTDKTGWGHFSTPLCPGKDEAIAFCKNVYAEIFNLFPYKFVHIGGDEVEKTEWEKCKDCQKRICKEELKSEAELQSWFTHEMEAFFNANGKQMIGWDEIIEGGLSKTFTVMWWRSWAKDASRKATAQGNKVIYTPNNAFYLDYKQDKKSVKKIYDYNPELEGMTDAQKALIVGVQGNIWCEYIPSRERMLYMAAPRMLAIAELGWSSVSPKNWEDFQLRMLKQLERLNGMKITYRIPDLEGFKQTNVFIGMGKVEVTCPDKTASVHYTTDGSLPTLDSPVYTGTINLTETTDFIFRTFSSKGKKGDFVKTRFVKSEYSPAVGVEHTQTGLRAVWHEYRGNTCSEIASGKKNGEYIINEVCIPEGVKGNIGLLIDGFINVPKDDIYTFSLLSDDGSNLLIDGKNIIDNDGPHSPRELESEIALRGGYHSIHVAYFDHNGGVLKLKVRNSKGEELSLNNLYIYQ